MAAWYAGLTVFALALAYRDRGLGRIPGTAIIAGYLAFVTALVISVAQGKVSPAVAALPAAGMAAAGALLLRRSPARAAVLAQHDVQLAWMAARIAAARMERGSSVEAQLYPVFRCRGL